MTGGVGPTAQSATAAGFVGHDRIICRGDDAADGPADVPSPA